ncbi:hypothetical protein AMTR_s00217p00025020 [Amborella trichopoda]|uniref:F-box/kelch-repeat protein n=3 Tax=Amborella trichopoda TaxID=13333 RepID=W1NZQ6_AMBTC|nr:hypothetical protein AMTR_s00217p00025020 [Amborella trichopoda]
MGTELIVIGGWEPTTWEPTCRVFLYNFSRGAWREGQPMRGLRSLFAAAAIDRRVYVAGGHDRNKNAVATGEVNNVDRDEWEGLPEMEATRDECEGLAVGDEFWVVTRQRHKASLTAVVRHSIRYQEDGDQWRACGVKGSARKEASCWLRGDWGGGGRRALMG